MKIRILFYSIFFTLLAFSSYAQTASLRISVYDQETGEALIGATAQIQGTTTGGVTDLDGKVTIPNLQPGKYNVEISYVSYQKKLIQDVAVLSGQPAVLEVKLAPEVIGLGEVVITAEAIKSSENALLTVQKKSPKVLDAVSSDQFSRNGDNNAAAAIKRVVGVTIEGGKYVYVRGLGDRYSKTILNGADIPGLDPNRNSVQLDLFPSNLIDNIIVYKTFSPDLTGEFSGGLVEINTKDFPDRFTMQASGSVGYNPQVNFNNNYLTYKGSSTDWLGYDNGYRSLPPLLQQYKDNGNFPEPYPKNNEITEASRAFTNRQFEPTRASQFMDHSLSFSIGNQKQLFGRPIGFIAGLTYRRDFNYYGDGTVIRYEGLSSSVPSLNGDIIFNNRDQMSEDETTLGAIFNTSYKINPNNKIGINLLYNQGGTKMTRFQSGLKLDNTPDSTNLVQTRVLSYTERSLKNAQIKGEHVIPGLNNVQIDWLSSYTSSTLDQPDLRFLSNNIFLDKVTGDSTYLISNQNRPGRYYRNMDEQDWDNKFNVTIPTKFWRGFDGKFKTGLVYTQKDRSFREDRYEYFLHNNVYNGDVETLFTDENLGYDAEGQLHNYLAFINVPNNNYDATQRIYGAYLMLETPVANKLRMTTGLRFERTEMNLESFGGVKGNLESNDYLPSINFTYSIKDNTNFRVSYGRTIARPTFREFAPLATFAFYGEINQLGNPNLERTTIDNFDLRWETYPSNSQYFGVSAFYKNFNNPIENTVNPQAGGNTREYEYANVPKGMVAGVELDVRKTLDFISPALANFKIEGNFSMIYSKVDLEADELYAIKAFDPNAKDIRPMFNQSPYVVNVSLNYSNSHGWSAGLTYNEFGKRLQYFQTDLPYIYERSRPDLNVSVAKQFTDHFSMRLRAENLINPDYRKSSDFKGNEFIYDNFKIGRSFSLGLTYLIN